MKLHVTTYQDRRTLEQLRHSDSIEEKRWRARIWLKQQRKQVASFLGSNGTPVLPHSTGASDKQTSNRTKWMLDLDR